MPTLSVALVVPVLNERENLRRFLPHHREQFAFAERVVVDGGSTDGTRDEVRRAGGYRLVEASQAGRGAQLAAGVRQTESNYVLFLHADSTLRGKSPVREIGESPTRWGWFRLKVDGDGWAYRLLEQAIVRRTRRWLNPTGDQAIWCRRDLLRRVGGVPDVPLMEDVLLARKLRGTAEGRELQGSVHTSARRWQEDGFLPTIVSMWWFRLLFYAGVQPHTLYKKYYQTNQGATVDE